MQTENREPILIAGAGIGGLTAALALRKRGMKVEVFERASELRTERGTALNIWSNAVTALDRLGLGDKIRKWGTKINRIQTVTWKGEVLMETPVNEYSQAVGSPSVNIKRADLLHILYEACRAAEIPVRFGSRCTGYESDDRGVSLRLEGKHAGQRRGPALIGADGLRSEIRKQLIGDGDPKYQGHTVWRGVSEGDSGLDSDTVLMIWGQKGVRGGCWPMDGHHVSWSIGINTEAGGRDDPGTAKSKLLQYADGFPPPFVHAIELTPEPSIFRTDVYAWENTDKWGKGRVTLLGDAAHAMQTVLGQGACQAIEDGVVLGESLAAADDPVTGLRSYEKRRKSRVDWVRSQVFKLGRFQEWENPLLLWVRNLSMKMMPKQGPDKMWRRLMDFDDRGEKVEQHA